MVRGVRVPSVLLKQQDKKNREREGAKETKSRKVRNETNVTQRRHDAKKRQSRKTERKNHAECAKEP